MKYEYLQSECILARLTIEMLLQQAINFKVKHTKNKIIIEVKNGNL